MSLEKMQLKCTSLSCFPLCKKHGVNGRLLPAKEDSALAKLTVQMHVMCSTKTRICVASAIVFYNSFVDHQIIFLT